MSEESGEMTLSDEEKLDIAVESIRSRVWDINQLISHNVMLARARTGMSQEELAQELTELTGKQWTNVAVSAIERSAYGGRPRRIDTNELISFAMAFKMPIFAFFIPPHRNIRQEGSMGFTLGRDPASDYFDWGEMHTLMRTITSTALDDLRNSAGYLYHEESADPHPFLMPAAVAVASRRGEEDSVNLNRVIAQMDEITSKIERLKDLADLLHRLGDLQAVLERGFESAITNMKLSSSITDALQRIKTQIHAQIAAIDDATPVEQRQPVPDRNPDDPSSPGR